MYARVATFEGGDPARLAEEISASRDQIERGFESPPEGLEGAKGVWMLVDRKSGKGLGITLFESEEELRRGDEALNRMSPPAESGAKRTSVEFYEVAIRSERS